MPTAALAMPWASLRLQSTMIERLLVSGFKSLNDVDVRLPRLTVLFGANAAGKSNLLDAVQALSRIGTHRTLSEALAEPIRGHPVEFFHFPSGGLAALLEGDPPRFTLGADLRCESQLIRYRISVQVTPMSGALAVADEYLAVLNESHKPKGHPAIEQIDGSLRMRRKSESGKPRYEPLLLNYSLLSDPRHGGKLYPAVEAARRELSGWHTYFLDPRIAMRLAQPPSDVHDIGVHGADLAPFLFRLRAEHPKRFAAVTRTLKSLVPSVESLEVELDRRRGTLDVAIRQDGTDYSSRIASEGTLRVIALCAVAVNPWSGSLLAFEEPENGVHPRRIQLIAKLLLSLALENQRQVIVTTHSPLFCDAVLRGAGSRVDEVGLYHVRREGGSSEVVPFEGGGPLFREREVELALTSPEEERLFENLVMRGLFGD